MNIMRNLQKKISARFAYVVFEVDIGIGIENICFERKKWVWSW